MWCMTLTVSVLWFSPLHKYMQHLLLSFAIGHSALRTHTSSQGGTLLLLYLLDGENIHTFCFPFFSSCYSFVVGGVLLSVLLCFQFNPSMKRRKCIRVCTREIEKERMKYGAQSYIGNVIRIENERKQTINSERWFWFIFFLPPSVVLFFSISITVSVQLIHLHSVFFFPLKCHNNKKNTFRWEFRLKNKEKRRREMPIWLFSIVFAAFTGPIFPIKKCAQSTFMRIICLIKQTIFTHSVHV